MEAIHINIFIYFFADYLISYFFTFSPLFFAIFSIHLVTKWLVGGELIYVLYNLSHFALTIYPLTAIAPGIEAMWGVWDVHFK